MDYWIFIEAIKKKFGFKNEKIIEGYKWTLNLRVEKMTEKEISKELKKQEKLLSKHHRNLIKEFEQKG